MMPGVARSESGTNRGDAVGMAASAVMAAEIEQFFGDLGDGVGAGVDVAQGGAGIAVPSLGHDRLKGHVVLAEMSRRGMA
jgi:hypothetical protein